MFEFYTFHHFSEQPNIMSVFVFNWGCYVRISFSFCYSTLITVLIVVALIYLTVCLGRVLSFGQRRHRHLTQVTNWIARQNQNLIYQRLIIIVDIGISLIAMKKIRST